MGFLLPFFPVCYPLEDNYEVFCGSVGGEPAGVVSGCLSIATEVDREDGIAFIYEAIHE